MVKEQLAKKRLDQDVKFNNEKVLHQKRDENIMSGLYLGLI